MDAKPLSPTGNDETLLDETEAMIWSLLDDQLDEADAARLEKLLLEHEQVRQRYIRCVQLHVDLAELFRCPEDAPGEKPGVVSSLIAECLPGAEGLPAGMES